MPALVWLGLALATGPSRLPDGLPVSLLEWLLLLVVLELVATEQWAGPGVSVPFAVRVTLAMLHDPLVAAVLALLGALDLRELRGHAGALHAVWRRCLALVVTAAGGSTFHAMAAGAGEQLDRVLPAFAATVALMYFACLAAETLDRRFDSGPGGHELFSGWSLTIIERTI